MITKEIALRLKHGDIVYHITNKGSDNRPVRVRVNGMCKIWKTKPYDFRIPMKWGLSTCFYIDKANMHEWREIE